MNKLVLLQALLGIIVFTSCSDDPVKGYMSHRGVHLGMAVAGENSLRAATLAYNAGFNCIETDCRYTADSVPVIMHDAKLNRTCINADGSPIKENVFVSDITLDSLKKGYLLRVENTVLSEPVPTLKEYLEHCRDLDFKVFIEPKLNDPTGRFYSDIISTADSVLGREGYVICSNNFANEVIRNTLGIKDVCLMGLLYQTDYDTMAALGGNLVYAVSSVAFPYKDYYAFLERARRDGYATQTSCCLLSQGDQVRYDTEILVDSVPYVNYVATDLAAPLYKDAKHRAGVLIDASSMKDCSKQIEAIMGDYDPVAAMSGLPTGEPPVKFGAIYLEMTYTGIGDVVVDTDAFVVNSAQSGGKEATVRYSRMVHDCLPMIMVDGLSPDFSVKSFNVKVLSFKDK